MKVLWEVKAEVLLMQQYNVEARAVLCPCDPTCGSGEI